MRTKWLLFSRVGHCGRRGPTQGGQYLEWQESRTETTPRAVQGGVPHQFARGEAVRELLGSRYRGGVRRTGAPGIAPVTGHSREKNQPHHCQCHNCPADAPARYTHPSCSLQISVPCKSLQPCRSRCLIPKCRDFRCRRQCQRPQAVYRKAGFRASVPAHEQGLFVGLHPGRRGKGPSSVTRVLSRCSLR